MYTGIEAMWLGKRFIDSIKADNGWIKQMNNDKRINKDYVSYLAEVWKVMFP